MACFSNNEKWLTLANAGTFENQLQYWKFDKGFELSEIFSIWAPSS